ncbi:DNA glycosylase [Scleroderma yunnanense]
MPKRRYVSASSDSDAFSDRVSQESDFSISEVQKSKRTSKTRKNTQRTRQNALKGSTNESTRPGSAATPSHPASIHVVTASKVDEVRESLLEWYDKVHDVRGMPWRKRYNPSLGQEGQAQRAYEVWISEIMLQQTQVTTVIPYYNRWMAKFPSIRELATSDIETVNSLWKGLGYYSRAARLLSAAQKVVKELDGSLPDNAKDMQAKIPGVGRYSAGAICSIAYNECAPVLDGNVHRLLSRFLALYAPPKGKQTQDILWAGAEAFVQNSSRAGDINQALIELGSTVCKVRDPTCSDCALHSWCQAYNRARCLSKTQESDHDADIEEMCTLCEPFPSDDEEAGFVTIYPMKVERKKAREELDSVNVIEWRTRDKLKRWFVLVRRPEGGLLAGLHEFPTVPNISEAATTPGSAPDIVDKLLTNLLVHPPSLVRKGYQSQESRCGSTNGILQVVTIRPAGDVVHVFSHIKKTYRVQWVILEGGGDEPPALRDDSCLSTVSTSGSNKRRKTSAAFKGENSSGSSQGTPTTRWLPLEEVESANIGTGVIKVWKSVKALWA